MSLWKAIFQRRMLICIFNGFTAGLPLFYLFQLIPLWLRDQGADLKTIGLIALVQIPYNWKFLWAPLLDRYVPPLGRRRGWMLITQILLLFSMASMSLWDPKMSIGAIAWCAFAIAFFSATQDIALDAYRRELLPDEELGLGNSMYSNAARLAGFIPGGLSIILADYIPWSLVHVATALFMFVGITKTLVISEAIKKIDPPKSLKAAVVEPFKEFFTREDVWVGIRFLMFLMLFKIGDVLATALQSAFFLDMGFSKTVIGSVAKISGVTSSIIGAFVGGVMIFKIGINRSLWICAVLQMVTILGFALLSVVGENTSVLALVMALEYLAAGMGSTGLIALMSRATSTRFTGTQFALFTSIMATPRTFSGVVAGVLVEGVGDWGGLGYTHFFLLCTLCAIPGLILLKWVAPWHERKR